MKPASTKPQVLVHLRLERVSAGWVKINGAQLDVLQVSSLKLPPGRYAVFKKHNQDDRFRKCGTFNLAADHEWKLFVGPTGCRAQAFES